MTFESEHAELVFLLKMALKSCRISPKPERHDSIRQIQAEHILAHLGRSGFKIVRTDEDRGIKPSNIGA
jgi:hypothetical protein